MAQLTRSRDHSIWFKHIDDPENEVLPDLKNLTPGQSVILRLGQRTGIWTRFNANPDGKVLEALKSGDENSKQIWENLPIGGPAVEIGLVEVLPPIHSHKSHHRSTATVTLEAISEKSHEATLCLAVDVAWWGGQTGTGKRDTRTETIAYACRETGEWSDLSLRRVDLNDSYNPKADPFTPNADADASTLSSEIKDILDAHSGIENVV